MLRVLRHEMRLQLRARARARAGAGAGVRATLPEEGVLLRLCASTPELHPCEGCIEGTGRCRDRARVDADAQAGAWWWCGRAR